MTLFKPLLKTEEKNLIHKYLTETYREREIFKNSSVGDFEIYVGDDFEIGDYVSPYSGFPESLWFFHVDKDIEYSGTEFIIVRKKSKIDNTEHVLVHNNDRLSVCRKDDNHTEIKLILKGVKNPIICNVIHNRVYLPYVSEAAMSMVDEISSGKQKTTISVKNKPVITFYKEIIKLLDKNEEIIFAFKEDAYKIPVRDLKLKCKDIEPDDKSIRKLSAFPVDLLTKYIVIPF